MKEIDNFKISINYLGGPTWNINIQNSENISFSKHANVHGQLTEELAYQHFKDTRGKDFFIDVSGEIIN